MANKLILSFLVNLFAQSLHCFPFGAIHKDPHSSMAIDPEDSLKVGFLEYLILGIIVALLLVLLFLLRFLMTLKNRCPQFCCSWVPSTETRNRSSTVTRPKFDKPATATGRPNSVSNDQSQLFN